MANDEALTSSSLSESDGNSILSGSVHYLMDLNEDSEAVSEEVDEARSRDEVLPYLFEPERLPGPTANLKTKRL